MKNHKLLLNEVVADEGADVITVLTEVDMRDYEKVTFQITAVSGDAGALAGFFKIEETIDGANWSTSEEIECPQAVTGMFVTPSSIFGLKMRLVWHDNESSEPTITVHMVIRD